MLYVYRASAGSGKTHLLTGFYLRLLFREDLAAPGMDRAALFDEILAVTFTNKATAEMKTRIIEELETLSHAPQRSPYYADLTAPGNVSDSTLRNRAGAILKRILNDYSDFHISTIDSFFQKIVRSFARELNIQGSYEVELNSDRVLEAAVSAFVDELDRKQDKALFEWMLDFSRDRISEGDTWDFKRELFRMSKVLVSEEYRQYSDQIARFTADKAAMRDYVTCMKRLVHDFKTAVRQTGEDGLTLLSRYGLRPENFSGGDKSFMRVLYKWAQGELAEPSNTFLQKAADPEKWFAASSDFRNALSAEATEAIVEVMNQAMRLFEEDYNHYLSAQAILSNFYQLGILADLDRKVREYCADQCVMLLSNTTELLNRLIGTADAPFIYEKVGAHINHFMIDEFQDTSGLQWSNFMPLLSNAIAEGHQNLIVGDVKQSIYRWRGSDWGLLYAGLDHYETPQRYDDSTTLRTNWRSAAEVVHFNNEFFLFAANAMQQLYNQTAEQPTEVFTHIYADVAQQVAPIRPQEGAGVVRVEYFAGKTVSERLDSIMMRLPEVVIDLQRHGYAPSDIAILCRTNDICTASVQALLQYRAEHPECPYCLDVISDEALKLSSRPAVQTLISLMRYLRQPSSPLLRAVALASLLQVGGHPMDHALHRYFEQADQQLAAGDTADVATDPLLSRLLRAAHRPLYEMVEELIALLPAEVRRSEEAFLQAFRDLVLEFINGRTTDLTAFLEWWDDSGVRQTIATPSKQEAVRVMTIHQSKGLGMPAVIIPYASWQLDIESRGILWCAPQNPTFARENLVVPIRITGTMPRTIFHREYDAERLRCIIDNLNTAYVALTRAKEAMILLTPEPTQPSASSKSTASLSRLERLLSDFGPTTANVYTRGQWVRPETPVPTTSETTEPTLPTAPSDNIASSLSAVDPARTLPRLSLKQSRLVAEDEAIQRGNAIHAALSVVVGAQDAARRIDDLYARGAVDAALIAPDDMKTLIDRLIHQPEAATWFSDEVRVLSEQTIVARGDVLKRPDRLVLFPDGRVVVIDYKTGRPHRSYPEQVRSYMRLLRQMGFEQVEGYLWYLMNGRVERVS